MTQTITKMREQFFELRDRYLLEIEEISVEFVKEREE